VLPHQGIEAMKTQGRFLFGVMAVATLMMGSLPALAQWEGYPTPGIPRLPDGKPNLSAPLPRTPDGKPDLSGIWQSTRGAFNIAVGLKPGESVPFNAAGKKIFDERRDNNSKDDPSARCQPTGIPVRNQLNTPMKIIQIPGVTVFLYESRTTYRQILTDGRPLPKVDWPAWAGFSIGKWEGDTFVVETAGFNGRAWLDQAGHPSTSALRLTERFTRRDFGHMDMEITIDDPNVYSRPWTIYGQFVLKADTELLEFICEENERDSRFMVGK
jgi:hypothetical protein